MLKEKFAAHGLDLSSCSYEPGLPPLTVTISRSDGSGPDVCIELSFPLDGDDLSAFRGRLVHFLDLMLAHLARYARTTPGPFSLTFDISDAGGSDAISFDRPMGTDWPLCPDLYILSANIPAQISFDDFQAEFSSRENILFWRGSTTGNSISSPETLLANGRVAACIRLKAEVPDLADCRISRVVQCSMSPTEAVEILVEKGIYGKAVDEEGFGAYRMYLDMPGNTAAWGTCLKYLRGCLIFHVFCPRQLFYSHLLKPWEHYIPVKADFSDVGERISWVQTNPHDALKIAWEGKLLMTRIVSELPGSIDRLFASNRRTPEAVSG